LRDAPAGDIWLFFRRPRFSAAVSSVGLVTFGLFGALFVLTQYLQFYLGFSA